MTANDVRHAFICAGWWIGLPTVFWLFVILLARDIIR